jgi:hypothetical protein
VPDHILKFHPKNVSAGCASERTSGLRERLLGLGEAA